MSKASNLVTTKCEFCHNVTVRRDSATGSDIAPKVNELFLYFFLSSVDNHILML